MRKLIVLSFLLIGFTTFAQKGAHQEKRNDKKMLLKDLSPEQRAILRTKKMTLLLDLSDNQQKQIQTLLIQEAKENQQIRKDHKQEHQDKKPSTEERFNMMNKRLDQKIAFKKKMKTILTKEQYDKLGKNRKKKRNTQNRRHS